MPAALIRAAVIWLLFILAESVQGALRRALFGPEVEWTIRQASVGLGVAILFAIAWFAIPWMRLRHAAAALAAGLGWAVMTVGFEIGLGRLTGVSWTTIASDYDPRYGGMMAIGLLAMMVAPLAAFAARRPVSARDRATASLAYFALAAGLSSAIVALAMLLAARRFAG